MYCTSLDMTLTVTLSPRLGGVAGLGLPLYMVFNPDLHHKLLYEAGCQEPSNARALQFMELGLLGASRGGQVDRQN